MTEFVGNFVLLAFITWFGFETWWDHKKSMILPLWLVLPPLIAGVIYCAVNGRWVICGAVAIGVCLHLSGNLLIRGFGTILLIGASAWNAEWFLAIGFGLFWLLWELHIMGGADAIGAYAAMISFPAGSMFWSLLGGILFWSIAGMLIYYRGRIFRRIRQMVFRVLMRDLPSEAELESEGKPTLGGIWMGVILFGIIRVAGI